MGVIRMDVSGIGIIRVGVIRMGVIRMDVISIRSYNKSKSERNSSQWGGSD